MNAFPIQIKYLRTNEIVLVKRPEDLRNGESFIVLKTNCGN